jgi:methyl-accepting chemotaxis protein
VINIFSLGSLSIRGRLRVVLVLVSIAIFSIFTVSKLSFDKAKKYEHIKESLVQIKSSIYELAHKQNQFSIQKDLKFEKEFYALVKSANIVLNRLDIELKNNHLEIEKLQKFKNQFANYQILFKKLVELETNIGLTKNDGLLGSLQKSVNSIKLVVDDFDDEELYLYTLRLRSYEKDYLLFHNISVVDKHKQMLEETKKFINQPDSVLDDIQQDRMTNILTKYRSDFEAIIRAYTIIGTDENSGIKGEMNRFTKQMEQSFLLSYADLYKEIADRMEFNERLMLIVTLVMIIVLLLTILRINKDIMNLITDFRLGLLEFFRYLNREKTHADHITIRAKGEIENMAISVNKQIDLIQQMNQKDQALIEDTTAVAREVANGSLSKRISLSTDNRSLNELKDVFNHMLSSLEKNIDDILVVVGKYTEHDYRPRVKNPTLKDEMATLVEGINGLGSAVSRMLVANKKNGIVLDSKADELAISVNKLSNSVQAQSDSFNATSADVEEITSTLHATYEKAEKMYHISEDTKDKSQTGQALTQETVEAMNSINDSTNNIKVAIEAINQIAFQTNILSLNAAVEAATAGEAGKGFAVVAGEVRNLANRSADVANDIKTLVDQAATQAENGKDIAANMLEGFKELYDNISTTTTLIEDVTKTSKEQLISISKINDTITELDSATSEDAIVAQTTDNIAKETSEIAKQIIFHVDNKEFTGKDTLIPSRD